MTEPLSTGLQGEAERVVTDDQTAVALGSGDVEVFGTPALAALIERAAVASIRSAIPADRTTVGTRLELDHLAPSRIGATVRARATLTGIDGNRLTFTVEAFDGDRLVGRATHRRVIVDRATFGR